MILYPMPDTVTLSAPVTNEMLLVPDQSGKSVPSIYGEIDLDMRDHLAALPLNSGGPVKLVKRRVQLIAQQPVPVSAQFSIEVAPERVAYLSLDRKPGLEIPSWKLRLEFSASKAGPEGLKRIEDGFEIAVGALLDFEKVLKSFVVDRLDVAVDCVGAVPLDFLVKVPKPGKRLAYFGDAGRPETAYFFAKKAKPSKPYKKGKVKTFGPTRLRMYERRAEHLQRGLPPPYGPSPITRVEVPTSWKKGRPLLSTLESIPNRFEGRHVGYAAGVRTPNPESWRKYCIARWVDGAPSVTHPLSTGLALRKAYESFVPDVLNPADWSGWIQGLAITGLQDWIERAKV